VRQKSFSDLINLLSVSVFERSFGSKFVNEKMLSRNVFMAKFDDSMTDGCQGKKDFLA